MTTKTLIVGGGLSGLRLADLLQEAGQDFMLIEARNRFGGRILTEHVGAGYYDMGPAWFWPGQPRIEALINRLGLTRFDQFADGILTMEDERGKVHRGRGHASMQGSWRLEGGLGALITALSESIPESRKRLNAEVSKIVRSDTIDVHLTTGETIAAQQVVFALPPRVVAQIAFDPALPRNTLQDLRAVPTWMAGQAKAIAVYDRPFWREAGLSGDAMSRFGPMVEIHDASPNGHGPHALFGFIGIPPQGRQDEQLLRQNLLAQLGRLFGPQASEPRELLVKDWAFDLQTSTQDDLAPLYSHPTYHPLSDLWDGQLHFAGTEVAPQFGGYLEGALEAAENTASLLIGT